MFLCSLLHQGGRCYAVRMFSSASETSLSDVLFKGKGRDFSQLTKPASKRLCVYWGSGFFLNLYEQVKSRDSGGWLAFTETGRLQPNSPPSPSHTVGDITLLSLSAPRACSVALN